MGGEFEGESVKTLREIANVLEKRVICDEGGDSGKKACGGGDEGFGDARSDGAKAGGAGSAEAGEGVNDAPNGAEKTDERGDAGGGGEPGHAFFYAANFLGGSELHADGDGLEGLKFWRRRIAGAGELGLELAITGGVDVGERGAGGDDALGIGDALGGAKDFEELVALALNASEETHFLEDERPGDQREEKEDSQNGARDPAGLRQNVEDVADEDGREQKNNISPSTKVNLCWQFQRNTRGRGKQRRKEEERKQRGNEVGRERKSRTLNGEGGAPAGEAKSEIGK